MDKISIIVPCYNEEKVLPAFYRETAAAADEIVGAECEFIFVDDGSRDHTREILEHFRRRTAGANIFLSQGISAKRRRCTPVWKMLPVTTAFSWMRTFSTLPHS